MEHATWLGLMLLLCYALQSVLSHGELEEAMQWMMMEEVNEYVNGEEKAKAKREIEFVLYKRGPNVGAPTKIDAPGTIHNGALSKKNKLRICVLGWHNTLHSEFVRRLVSLYTNKEKFYQMVVVNWKGAQMDYVGARRLVDYVAETMHKYLLRLQKEVNVDLGKLIIIGHGLGAQIAGAVGHRLGGKIGGIIALDPLAPLFWQNTHDTVNSSAAVRVIGVHTSAGYLGVYWNVGHVDFWVNRGSAPQPGCYKRDWRRAIVCSHEKSFRYFIEAVRNENAFHTIECGKKLACTPADQRAPLATGFFFERTNLTGQFCFNTHPTAPYSVGKHYARRMRPRSAMARRRRGRRKKGSRKKKHH